MRVLNLDDFSKVSSFMCFYKKATPLKKFNGVNLFAHNLKVFKLIFYPFPKQKQKPHERKIKVCGDFLFAEF